MLAHLAAAKLIDLGHQAVEELTVVRDDDSGAVEGLDGFLEHVFRGHIEVVGGLVENQEVDGFQQQADHGQTAALTATEHFYALLRGFAAKHKGAEYVVDSQSDITLGHIVDGLKHSETLIQQLCLILGKIANLHIVPHLERALEGNLAHDTLHQR